MIEHVADPAALTDLLHLAQAGTFVLCGIRRFNFTRALRTLLTLRTWTRSSSRTSCGLSCTSGL